MSSFALRFAVEVAFLVLLALAVGLAELATPWIVAVMVVGWLLVAVIEWLAWRSEQEPDDEAQLPPRRVASGGGHVVGSRRDPRAAARGRQVSPVLVQRLLALGAAALLTGAFGVALSQAGRDSSESALARAGGRPVGRLDDGARRRRAAGSSGGEEVRLRLGRRAPNAGRHPSDPSVRLQPLRRVRRPAGADAGRREAPGRPGPPARRDAEARQAARAGGRARSSLGVHTLG